MRLFLVPGGGGRVNARFKLELIGRVASCARTEPYTSTPTLIAFFSCTMSSNLPALTSFGDQLLETETNYNMITLSKPKIS